MEFLVKACRICIKRNILHHSKTNQHYSRYTIDIFYFLKPMDPFALSIIKLSLGTFCEGEGHSLRSMLWHICLLFLWRIRINTTFFILIHFFNCLGRLLIWDCKLVVWFDQRVLFRWERNPRSGYRLW